MRKHNSLTIVTACLLTAAVIWSYLPIGVPKTDEARFQRWKQTSHLWIRTVWWERNLPDGLGKLFKLPIHETKYLDEGEALREALLASGYFTNFPIAVAAAPTNYVQRAQVADRLRKAFQNRDDWEFWVSSNAIIMTCRPQDMDLCRKALQE